jgi:hypothetical protein
MGNHACWKDVRGSPVPLVGLRSAATASGVSHDQMWIGYRSMGGVLGSEELAEALAGRRWLSEHEHNKVAASINEHLIDQGVRSRAPYIEVTRGGG